MFSLFLTVFSFIYLSIDPLASGDDHFFHIRFAEQMREKGVLESFRDFKSIYFSKMAQGNEYFVYYNFLFYLVLIPFTFISPLYLGAKLYAVFAAALIFTIFYWCLSRLRVRWPLFWTLAVFALSSHFLIWRFFLSRPYTLAPAFLLLLLVFLDRKKHWLVFLTSFAYLFWHSATFFFPPLVAGAYFVFEKFCGRPADRRNLLAAVGGAAGAVALVSAISPGFLHYIYEIVFGIFYETILGKKVVLAEGGEVYPSDAIDFLRANALLISVLLIAVSAEIYRYFWRKRQSGTVDKDELTEQPLRGVLFFIVLALFLATELISSRFGDYFLFFAGLYIALTMDFMLRFVEVKSVSIKRGLVTGIIVMVVGLFGANMLFLYQALANGVSVQAFSDVGKWLRENTKPGEVVFNADWSWFPQLYYHSPRNNYLAGLEPRFFYAYNPRLYWLWWNIATQGYLCSQEKCPDLDEARRRALRSEQDFKQWNSTQGQAVADAIRRELQSSYIVTSRRYQALNTLLANNSRFEKVFSDWRGSYAIYQILTAPSNRGIL